jgi:hypothetical protein
MNRASRPSADAILDTRSLTFCDEQLIEAAMKQAPKLASQFPKTVESFAVKSLRLAEIEYGRWSRK